MRKKIVLAVMAAGLLVGGVAEAATPVVRGSYDTEQHCKVAGVAGLLTDPGWTEYKCVYDSYFNKWVLYTDK